MTPPVLLTGASGYVGGRLLPVLAARGPVRCLARNPAHLAARAGAGVEVVPGDVLDPSSLAAAFEGVHTAYYLVHSMSASGDFEEMDRRAARNFGAAARQAGVRRIIYLGGLGQEGPDLSPHLRSRHEVGRLLAEAGVPVLEFRASIIIGSGSLSFEMIRALVERLPVMIAPLWVNVISQPIGIQDLLAYLAAALDLPPGPGRVYEIGGVDRLSYGDLMREYAALRGLRRWIISVPMLTPRLSSLWLGLVTPVYARVGRALIDSIRHPTVVNDDSARRDFPVRPTTARQAMALALRNEEREFAATRWSDALSSSAPAADWAGARFHNRVTDSRAVRVDAPPERAFTPIRRIGGRSGWYFGQFLWKLRGYLDLLVGGPGLRRGRRDPETPAVGDALDFWRVEAYEPHKRLRLRAEMRLPGRAWLEFEVVPDGTGAIIRQTAVFDPVGLSGLAYWYALYPVHRFIFAGMLNAIARMSMRRV